MILYLQNKEEFEEAVKAMKSHDLLLKLYSKLVHISWTICEQLMAEILVNKNVKSNFAFLFIVY